MVVLIDLSEAVFCPPNADSGTPTAHSKTQIEAVFTSRIRHRCSLIVPGKSANRTSQVLGLYMDDFRVYRDLAALFSLQPNGKDLDATE